MPREIDPTIRQKTLAILRERFKPAGVDIASAVYLSEPERRNVLMRINLTSSSESVPKSIILKQVLTQPGDPDDKRAEARFARDWAGLEFTSRIQGSEAVHSTPIFYGSDAAQRFILIEDLGEQHVSLVDSLLLPDRDKAVSALQRYMKALGSFHATTFDHSDEYTSILKRINQEATTPEEDLASTTEFLLPKLKSNINLLAIPVPEAFQNEVNQVLDSMFKPGPFTVLTHGDIAPDNVFDHEGTKGLQLIDFEWCAPRNALLDGSFLRMSIPTGWCAKAIPDDVLKPLEQIYRSELIKTVPEASNDLAYSTAYTHACAFHVLHQMANLDDILDNDALWGSAHMPKFPLWDPATNSIRSRFLSRLQAFVDVTTEHDRLHPGQPPILPNLRKMAEDMLIKVKERWPADTKPLDFFPAFQQDTLRLVQTLDTSLEHTIKSAHVPGVSVVEVSASGEIAKQSAGVVNSETQQPVTDATVFEAASLSKPVFAYIVLKMVERGELDLDQPLAECMRNKGGFGPPFSSIRDHPNYEKLTARMILSHQAGLPNEFEDRSKPETFQFVSEAGTQFNYSGEAYCFLQEVVEKTASKSLETLAQEAFHEIGMKHSSFVRPTIEERAVGHLADGAVDPNQHFFGIHPAGSLSTTAEDYGRFLSACVKDPFVRDQMFTTRECGLVRMTTDPTRCEFVEVKGISRGKDAVILFDNRLFYVDQVKKEVKAIEINDDNRAQFEELKQVFHHSYTQAGNTALRLITSVTSITPPLIPSLSGRDTKAINHGVPDATLQQIQWGLGIGLQKMPNEDLIAFHWGDANTCRNFAAINLATDESVACFTNSANGPAIFRQIAEPVVGDLSPAFQWLSQREGLNFGMNATVLYRGAMNAAKMTSIAEANESAGASPDAFNPLRTTPKPPDSL